MFWLPFQKAELDEKAREMMMLKFGRVVNLEALEGLATNKLIGELEEQLQAQEAKLEKGKRMVEVSVFGFVCNQKTEQSHLSSCIMLEANNGSQTDVVGGDTSQHTQDQSALPAAYLQQAAGKAAQCQAEVNGKAFWLFS